MRDLRTYTQFLLEGKKHVDQATIGDFAKWACLGQMPDGKSGKVEPKDCQALLDNGWFDNFDDSNPDKACKEIAKFLNDNWDENIKVTSKETPNDWEISFWMNDEEYVVALTTYFGDLNDL